MFMEAMVRGGPLGFPTVRANGGHLRGRSEWERLRDPAMYAYLPRVLEQIEEYERARGRPVP